MEKYVLGFLSTFEGIIFGLTKGAFEGVIVFSILFGCACICKKLEEVRDKR